MGEKEDMAEERTDWAEDRTKLANERTFNAWMGTGLGNIGVAVALKAVFGEFDPTWAAKAVASLFLLTALVLFWMAAMQARRNHERLSSTKAGSQPTRNFVLIAGCMSVATLGTGAILWSL